MNYFLGMAILICIFFLQYFLCKRKRKWIGMILPILTFSISIYLNLERLQAAFAHDFSGAMLAIAMWMCIAYNMPTFLLVMIYRRQKKK